MHEPPDIAKYTTRSYQLGEPKFIVIKSKNESSFKTVSPFIIEKSVDFACGGRVDSVKKTRDGGLLIKTKNNTQTTKLLKLTKIGDMEITATEHKTLNFSKGVIYCNDLRYIDEETILRELKPQKVIEVKKIMKRQNTNNNTNTNNYSNTNNNNNNTNNNTNNNNNLTETGLIIITFETHQLPEILRVGYESFRVRNYIPLPMRCRKCLRFGHPAPICKSTEKCLNCSDEKHTSEGELCKNDKKCLNCANNPEIDSQHSRLDRKCPTFLKQQELTAIKTTEKVDHRTALGIYFERHGYKTRNSYANTLTNTTTTIGTRSPNTLTSTSSNAQTTSTSCDHNQANTPTSSASIKTTPAPENTLQNHNQHDQDDTEDMETDNMNPTKITTAYRSQLTKELKLKLFPKDKSNPLCTNFKPTKSKAKSSNKNKHTTNSDSESV
ncbi:hybrid signal transduction protein dokA-like [Drosophila elegans]|uniref:hybrid signal transduction protein dokA-like n=1 Tax=Drosophila elegans TaxID=30023 RepID=UPI001BC83F88|nr:hybrid signal transduction protein dokA-like [Drosophila elegans]